MFIFENQIAIADRPLLESYLNGYDYQTSGLTFTSLYMWRNVNGFCWEPSDEYLLLAGNSYLEDEKRAAPFLLPPLTAGGYHPRNVRTAILRAAEVFEKKGFPFQIRLLPAHMRAILEEAFAGELNFAEDRPNYDYVYRRADLAELKGKAYHGKKNHLNYFRKNYKYEYIRLTSDMTEEALAFIREFNCGKEVPEHEAELLNMEERAIEDALRNLESAGYLGGAIRIDKKLQALTIGGRLDEKTAVVHVEKANTDFRGLYQAINNEFCKNLPSSVEYVNREEDMGIPNLRKAKESYRPVKMIEKYIVTFK